VQRHHAGVQRLVDLVQVGERLAFAGLAFAQQRTGKALSSLSLADLDAALIGAFLQRLEDNRGNGSAEVLRECEAIVGVMFNRSDSRLLRATAGDLQIAIDGDKTLRRRFSSWT